MQSFGNCTTTESKSVEGFLEHTLFKGTYFPTLKDLLWLKASRFELKPQLMLQKADERPSLGFEPDPEPSLHALVEPNDHQNWFPGATRLDEHVHA